MRLEAHNRPCCTLSLPFSSSPWYSPFIAVKHAPFGWVPHRSCIYREMTPGPIHGNHKYLSPNIPILPHRLLRKPSRCWTISNTLQTAIPLYRKPSDRTACLASPSLLTEVTLPGCLFCSQCPPIQAGFPRNIHHLQRPPNLLTAKFSHIRNSIVPTLHRTLRLPASQFCTTSAFLPLWPRTVSSTHQWSAVYDALSPGCNTQSIPTRTNRSCQPPPWAVLQQQFFPLQYIALPAAINQLLNDRRP